jgi:phosphatidylserine/phosphatidylglycerophosphate/cardiolipin synthase-like enzyme
LPKAQIDFLILPYDSQEGISLIGLLVEELAGRWKSFRAAVAFVRRSGNFPVLLDALRAFAAAGNTVSLTFGADLFGGDSPASDYQAVEELLSALEDYPNAAVNLYHEPHRTFHPKMYVFANEDEGVALIVLGSSNWSEGGLLNNVEANVIIRLDFLEPGHREFYEKALAYFTAYWSEQ